MMRFSLRGYCWVPSSPYFSSRAQMSQACFSRAPPAASANLPCARRSAQAADVWSAKLSLKVLCSACLEEWRAAGSRISSCACSSRSRPKAFHVCKKRISICGSSRSRSRFAFVSDAIFGLAPALSNPAPEQLCGRDVRATTRRLLRQTLVAAQIAVSLVLLTCAGLLLRSLWNLQRAPTGMETDNVLTETISLAAYRYPQTPQQIAFFAELQRRLQPLPGTIALALSDTLPPAGQMRSTILAAVEPEGYPPIAEDRKSTRLNSSHGYISYAVFCLKKKNKITL